VAPNVLSYVNAGYVDSEWSGSVYTSLKSGGLGNTPLLTTPGFHRDGWFVGGGVESGLNIFGIAAPGWSLRSEYRAAYFDRIALPENWHPLTGGAGPTPDTVTFKSWVQTISTSLVYRFNSDGPATTKY
jgi:outer membrane immunogenic protein